MEARFTIYTGKVQARVIYFIRDLKTNSTYTLRLLYTTIRISLSCRYLGVYVDTRLRWDYYRENIEAAAIKRLLALSTLASLM